jgi:hypothetical protein
MQKNFTKESKEREMFGSFWDICQKYWLPEKSDRYWNALAREVDKFVEEYKDVSPVVLELGCALVSGLQKKYDNDNDYNKQMEMFGGK